MMLTDEQRKALEVAAETLIERFAAPIRALLSASKPAAPEGWKLVPVEMNADMLHAMRAPVGSTEQRYKAMLAASPAAPSADAQDERGAFEAWYCGKYGEQTLYRRDVKGSTRIGQYCNHVIQEMWETWQARAASPQATATQPAQTERALTVHDLRNIEGRLMGSGYVGTMAKVRALLTAAQAASGSTEGQ